MEQIFVEVALELRRDVAVPIYRRTVEFETPADRQFSRNRRRGGVTLGELLGGEFEIEIEDGLGRYSDGCKQGCLRSSRDFLGDVDCEEAFAGAGAAEQDGDLAFFPERAEELAAAGAVRAAAGYPLARRADFEHRLAGVE